MGRFRKVGPKELRAAANMLETEERKWCRNSYYQKDLFCGPVCALGAVFFANTSTVTIKRMENKAINRDQMHSYISGFLIGRMSRWLFERIVYVNDVKGRKQVIREMHETADSMEKKRGGLVGRGRCYHGGS